MPDDFLNQSGAVGPEAVFKKRGMLAFRVGILFFACVYRAAGAGWSIATALGEW